jgi:hypothetical protein
VPPRKKTKNWAAIRSTTTQAEFSGLIRRYPHRTNIVAEGDSWFAYPRKWLFAGKPNNIINYLKRMERFNLLHLASNGDEAVDMLSGKSKFKLLKSIHKQHVHYLLFSGGGNDIVGRWDFDYFLKRNVNSGNFEDYLHKGRLNRRITQITHAYEDLIALCGEYSLNKQIKIVTHTYDHLVPSPAGAEFIGGLFKVNNGKSWMYPYLEDKAVPRKLHMPLVKYLINRLAENLLKLQVRHPEHLVVADTRGMIDPKTGWLNEIHPRPGGFKRLADEIHKVMQAHPVA